jgi:hypothetical protein
VFIPMASLERACAFARTLLKTSIAFWRRAVGACPTGAGYVSPPTASFG